MTEPGFSISEIAEITGGQVVGVNEGKVHHFITDSRSHVHERDTLFICLRTAKRHGKVFIPDMVEKGVRFFLVDEQPANPAAEQGYIVVEDTLRALQKIAAAHRQRFDIPVIAITGSNGKTIVKEWLYELLRGEYNIIRSPKSYNSQLGVAKSLLNMRKEHGLAIIEAGISQPDEMEHLQRMIQPTLGVFTNLGQAHNAGFESEEVKGKEKVKLFAGIEVVHCTDQENIGPLQIDPALSWGKDGELLKLQDQREVEGRCVVTTDRGEFELPFTDVASIENAMHVVAVAVHLGISPDRIREVVAELQPVAMRLESIEGRNGCLIINDAYNADLGSLEIALVELNRKSGGRKKTVIMSDILQDKANPDVLYGKVVDLLKNKQVDRMIGVGERISDCRHLFSDLDSKFYPTTEALADAINTTDFRNEAILVKGARPFRFELVVDRLQEKTNKTVFEINLSALEENLNTIRENLDDGTKIMAMVKAYGYGAGSATLGKKLKDLGVDYFGVAHIDEGIEMKGYELGLPIMVLNPELHGLPTMVEHELEPVVYNLQELDELIRTLILKGIQDYPIHINLDTGMHRLGFDKSDLPELIEMIKAQPEVRVQSIFTHLAASEDSGEDEFTETQLERFEDWAALITGRLGYSVMLHALNSAGTQRFTDHQFDMVRVGIAMFGVSANDEALRSVCALKTTVSQVKELSKGETIGYNRAYTMPDAGKIAVIPIGYADGFRRSLSNGVGKVTINGQQYPVAGNVCMDMCMIDVTGSTVKAGDVVEIFGDHQSLNAFANAMQTIPYEVLTSIPNRVKRVYVTD